MLNTRIRIVEEGSKVPAWDQNREMGYNGWAKRVESMRCGDTRKSDARGDGGLGSMGIMVNFVRKLNDDEDE